MSKKAAEHHKQASEHLTHAARHHGEAAKHDWRNEPGEADTVVTDRFTVGHDAAHAPDHDAAEETDDYAWAPGRADPR